ncbi:hypothetical protein ELQ90_00635 [Labedella phragmitis]|uniref:Uncharacterized protein n=1 Tax=Labedella phragmitis TaxID=2498849 RepID=A0A3S3ZAK3_9MICO|nr:hypothetical protein [Labedella phragmitis]RWZ52500.1 hypothetical protein ELQ90_00635 [Labedella phragmitis]
MPARYPTAVLAIVRRGEVADELRLTITTNTGRVLDEWVVYSREFDAAARADVERRLDAVGLRNGRFEGSAQSGWRAVVRPVDVDPAAATD